MNVFINYIRIINNKILEYNRIDISEGIDITLILKKKESTLKKKNKRKYWYAKGSLENI